jgi:hypothetical protein
METGDVENKEELVEEVSAESPAADGGEEGSSPEAEASVAGEEGAFENGDQMSRLEARLAKLTGGGAGAPEGGESGGREVSAATIGRMLGLATASELKLMEGKIDLLSTRVNNMTVRMEKVISILGGAPTGSDLERVDMQIGSLRVMLREAFNLKDTGDVPPRETPGPGERGDKPITSAKIMTNTDE